MSGYKHGASTADPIRRARLDRHENPPRHWGQGNERLWAATREVADWERRNPSRATISKRRDNGVRQIREEHN